MKTYSFEIKSTRPLSFILSLSFHSKVYLKHSFATIFISAKRCQADIF